MDLNSLYHCQQCPRLAAHLTQVRANYPKYYAHPVAPFGAENPHLFIVGLAPGMHGANASGRPFTGDYAGILLYQTLYDYGFSNQPTSEHHDDGLELINCRISNAVKCLPPENKPTTAEIKTCNSYLSNELQSLSEQAIVLALGSIAHQAVLRAFNLKLSAHTFQHNTVHTLPNGLRLLDSYHCSRYNTQTRRLTPEMFQAVFETARALLN